MSLYTSKDGEIQTLLSKEREIAAKLAGLLQMEQGNIESIGIVKLKKERKDIKERIRRVMFNCGGCDGGDIA